MPHPQPFRVSEHNRSVPSAMSHSAAPAGFRLQPPLPELEYLAELQRSHVKLRPPRGRMNEILAVVLDNSQEVRRHFLQRLQRETSMKGGWRPETTREFSAAVFCQINVKFVSTLFLGMRMVPALSVPILACAQIASRYSIRTTSMQGVSHRTCVGSLGIFE